jgi:hypothetical protein
MEQLSKLIAGSQVKLNSSVLLHQNKIESSGGIISFSQEELIK